MGLFGKLFDKKKEAPAPQVSEEKSAAFKAFAAGFLPEERSILAVTGQMALTGRKLEGCDLKVAGTELTAWMDADTFELARETTQLVVIGEDELVSLLRSRIPQNFILKFKARLSKDGKCLLLLDLPEPGFDPDLKAILEEQKKPVTLDTEDLGTFTLNRMYDLFQGETDWLEESVILGFSHEEESDRCLDTARTLLADAADWDEKIRRLAADRLLDKVNEMAAEDEDPVEREEFMTRIALDSIVVTENGGFQFFFSEEELLWGNMIQVSGTLDEGPTDAQMEG